MANWQDIDNSRLRRIEELEAENRRIRKAGRNADLVDRFAMAVAPEVVATYGLEGETDMQYIASTVYDLAEALIAERARRRKEGA